MINGKPLVIDFMGEVIGVRDRGLRRGVSEVEVGADMEGRSITVRIAAVRATRICRLIVPH
jgi:hypothetical protein